MTLLGSMLCCVALVLTVTPATNALWGGIGSEINDFMLHKELTKMENSKHLHVIALYRDGCGYCELLKPEWEKLALKMRKQIGVAAVDVVNHQHISKALQDKYKFEVKGVPTIVILKPKANGKKTLVVYEGERKAKAMAKAFSTHMPEFVATISDSSYDAWEAKPGAKAVLFSKKKEVPTVLKALSTKYQGRMHFGIVDSSATKLKALFSVAEYPQLYIVPDGKTVGPEFSAIPYKGSNKFFRMDSFLLDYAGDKPPSDSTSSPSSSSKSKKSDKVSSSPSPSSKDKKDKTSKDKTDKTSKDIKDKAKPAKNKDDSTTPSKKSTKAEKKGDKKQKVKGDQQSEPSSNTSQADAMDKETEQQLKDKKEREKQQRKEKREKARQEAKNAAKIRKEKEAKKKKPKSGLRTLPQPANPIVLKGADLKSLSVKDLKGILARWDDPCKACTEKDQFLMKIADNRKEYGDMEAIAKMYAKKPSKKRSSSAHPDGNHASKRTMSFDDDEGESDVLCGRLLKMEMGPLQDQIQQLSLENDELKQRLADAQEPLVHGEL
eukprot:m.157449 g.157449  ORF g.157449 m.157449 type:complete len:549 (-) comp31056_c2_seq1:79-1725(-)